MSFLSALSSSVNALAKTVTDAVGGGQSSGAPSQLVQDMFERMNGGEIQTRDHRTSQTVPAQRGSGTDYDAMLAAGDFRGIIEASRTDPAAKKFLQDNAQAVQLAIQDDSFLKTTLSNILNAVHQGEMSISRNIQA